MPHVRMVYFAQAREAAGRGSEDVVLPEVRPTVQGALSRAFATHPRLAAMQKSIRVAVNEAITSDDVVLRDGDTVALLPPVAGG